MDTVALGSRRLVKEVIYTAAHGGFAVDHVPLGGGGAVCEHLTAEWRRNRPFPFQLLEPSILGETAPRGKDLVQMSERAYARFCRAFEKVSTEAILACDPADTVVLANDISEGPHFRRVAERGMPVYTIYHVDVVDYLVKIYLHSWVRPETTTRLYARLAQGPLGTCLPDIVKLVWQKQQDSVVYSKGLIVPSQAMADILCRCYPAAAGKVHVIPWGIWEENIPETDVEDQLRWLRETYQVPAGARVILTLSRISPEKGQDRLLRALSVWEKQGDVPANIIVFIAGEAAYMKGKQFQRQLERLAKRLRRARVVFPGYASGARKQALFRLADLYVFPSRHESYGLTLLEAMRAGLPVLAASSHGVREVFQPGIGEMLPAAPESELPKLIAEALERLLGEPADLHRMGEQARKIARAQGFEKSAAQLGELLTRS